MFKQFSAVFSPCSCSIHVHAFSIHVNPFSIHVKPVYSAGWCPSSDGAMPALSDCCNHRETKMNIFARTVPQQNAVCSMLVYGEVFCMRVIAKHGQPFIKSFQNSKASRENSLGLETAETADGKAFHQAAHCFLCSCHQHRS